MHLNASIKFLAGAGSARMQSAGATNTFVSQTTAVMLVAKYEPSMKVDDAIVGRNRRRTNSVYWKRLIYREDLSSAAIDKQYISQFSSETAFIVDDMPLQSRDDSTQINVFSLGNDTRLMAETRLFEVYLYRQQQQTECNRSPKSFQYSLPETTWKSIDDHAPEGSRFRVYRVNHSATVPPGSTSAEIRQGMPGLCPITQPLQHPYINLQLHISVGASPHQSIECRNRSSRSMFHPVTGQMSAADSGFHGVQTAIRLRFRDMTRIPSTHNLALPLILLSYYTDSGCQIPSTNTIDHGDASASCPRFAIFVCADLIYVPVIVAQGPTGLEMWWADMLTGAKRNRRSLGHLQNARPRKPQSGLDRRKASPQCCDENWFVQYRHPRNAACELQLTWDHGTALAKETQTPGDLVNPTREVLYPYEAEQEKLQGSRGGR
ncbi:uncharacterized protein CLUP02_05299 [Colletotrichum lupini]|uniref:Uncharacterized protein n=1 Tax=Colletotrichum lupini TaxID=145971 RepID=A0A9Q8SLX1_9PEZI|nr:uncharacterized protein CLUP02_05299 [Colletotrichum lupini]UQC79819.1 hypothetical protein CLUP02_05299 [Colletotrichum lupini]